jgi:hypothetical protein
MNSLGNFTKAMRLAMVLLVTVAAIAWSQQPMPSLTNGQIAFLRHLLITVGDPHHDPKVRKLNEAAIANIYGLTSDEASVVREAAAQFSHAIKSFEERRNLITANKSQITDADRTNIAMLSQELDMAISTNVNRMISSVRPQTRQLLLLQGDLVSSVAHSNNKKN